MAGRPKHRAMLAQNPEAQTIVARDTTCRCGCQGQDPWHKRTYKRTVRDVVAVAPVINQSHQPVTTVVARGKASFPWGTEEVVDVRHTFDGKVWGLRPEWRLAKTKRNPAVVKAKAKKVVDKTSQAYEQRQAARGFGGYAKMDPCPACGKRRAVEPCIGTDEGGKCPESSKWVGDAICMQCINVERRKAGLQAVDVYGEPLIRKAKRNPYKDKILLPSGNIQYVYGAEDVAKRQREKAQRIEGFKNREEALLRAVKRDVAKGDDTALAIGLIMTTYERPGNAESAKDGHYGVTGWECRHLSKEGKSAVALDYVGKSGVQQHKVVTDPALVRALLARQRQCKRRGEKLLDTSPSSVNRYLADYGVRAKDLRTFGANIEMQAELTRLRKAGPRLSSLKPRDLKRTLKAEFMAAVATVAGKLGHTTTMLRRQYLVKEMEPTYVATGRVVKAFA